MSQLGGAQLVTHLDTSKFEAGLKRLEQDALASFKRISVASKDILAKGAFSTGASEIKTLTAALKPLTNALELVAAAGVKVGDGVGGGAGKAKPPLTDLQKSILALKNETAAYRSVVESTDVSNKDAIANFTRLKTESLALASSLDVTSKEYRDLVGVSAQASRSIKTLSDETTRLGLSGNVAVANTRTLRGQLGNLQGAVAPLLGGLGLAGLATVSGELATKANAVNVSYDILSLTMDRLGASSSTVQDSIGNTASALGVAEGQVVDYATQLLRMGVAAEDIDDVLIAGGSSALAFGKTAAQGIESVTSALVTQNSQNLNTIGIAENIGKAMGDAADGAAKYGEEASKQAAAQEGVRIILKATADEVASLDKLTGGLAGSQSEAATAAFELRQRMGEALIPLETLKNDVLSGLLDSFEGLPVATQASVAGIGGVTVATSALATALATLRPLLAAAFLPPAGMIILGATAAAALGTALFTLAKNAKNTVTPLKSLGENAEITQTAIGNASDKESLAGALEDLSGQLDGKGKKALKNYATEVRNAKGDVDDLKKSASDLVTQVTLDQALTTRAEMVAKLKVIPEVEGLDPQGIVDDLEARLNRSPEFQGQGIQLKLGIVEEGGQYAIQVLEGISENATLSAESFALLDDSLNETNVRLNTTAQAAGTQLRGEIQRLDTFIQSLRDSLASTAPVAEETGENLDQTGTGANNAADGLTTAASAASTFDTAISDASSWATRLSREAEQGIKPVTQVIETFKGRLRELRDEQERLAKAGLFGKQYDLADEKIRLLEAAIESLTGAQDEGVGSANDYSDSLTDLSKKATAHQEAQDRAVQSTLDLVAANREAANSAAPYDAAAPTALTEALEAAVKQSGYMTDAQREANLELRATDESAESLSDSLAGLNEESRIVGRYFVDGAASASDFTAELDRLNAKAAEASINLRNSATGAESFSDTLAGLNNLSFQVSTGQSNKDERDKAAERQKELNKLGIAAVDIFGDLTTEILGADTALGKAAGSATDFVSALVSGNPVGAISAIVNVGLDAHEEMTRRLKESTPYVEKYGLEWLKANGFLELHGNAIVVNTEKLQAYEAQLEETGQYEEAVAKYGRDIADSFVEIDRQGNITFNEEGLAEYEKGLERITQTVDDLEQELKDVKDAVDSVNEAELEAKQLTLDAKIEGQDGAYSVNDILSQVDLDIAEAAQKRDAAYHEAYELEAAGYADLAARRRAAADQAYQAEISMIKEGAEDRAEAIGQNNGQFQSALDQSASQSEQYWQDYWNADTNAQIQAQARAREQLRRQQAVMNSQRYQDLLNAGYTEQEAYRLAAEGLGYTIDATTGDLVSATDAAAQGQSQAAAQQGSVVSGAFQAAFGLIGGAAQTGSSLAAGQVQASQGFLNSAIGSLFGSTSSTLAAQGGALASTVGGVYAQLASATAAGVNAWNTTLSNGANLNLGNIASITNSVGNTIGTSGGRLAAAEAAKANLLIKQRAEGAKKEAQAESKLAGEVGKVIVGVTNARVRQEGEVARVRSSAIAAAYNAVIGTIARGAKGEAQARQGVFSNINIGNIQGAMEKLLKNPSFNFGGNFSADWAKVYNPEDFKEQQAGKVKAPGSASVSKVPGSASASKALDKAIGGGSGKSPGGSGSSGKKDGSSYSGGSSKDYPQGSPGWYQAKINEIEEQIKKTSSQSKIRSLQAQRDKLDAQLAALLGTDKSRGQASAPAGSINALEEQLQAAREVFENATTDKARAAAAARVKLLEAELEEKRALLKDAAKDMRDTVRGETISIESPIADLGSLSYLLDSVSSKIASLPASVTSSGTAAAASVTALPQSYSSTVLPAYQEQQDLSKAHGAIIDRFGGYVDRFGSWVARLERLGSGSPSSLPDKAAGRGLYAMNFR